MGHSKHVNEVIQYQRLSCFQVEITFLSYLDVARFFGKHFALTYGNDKMEELKFMTQKVRTWRDHDLSLPGKLCD